MALTVREATLEDVPLILPMMERFNAYELIKTWTRDNGEAPLRKLIGDPSIGIVGLVFDTDAIGYFVVTWGFDLEWGGRDAVLTELFLEEKERAQKRGPQLVAAVERMARAHGASALHLMVRTENEPARRLYTSCGFKIPPRHFMTKRL